MVRQGLVGPQQDWGCAGSTDGPVEKEADEWAGGQELRWVGGGGGALSQRGGCTMS